MSVVRDRTAKGGIDIAAQLDAGAAHYLAGRIAEAQAAYQRVEAVSPTDPRAIYSLAVIDLRQGRLQGAIRRLRRVVKIDPNLGPAHHNLGYACQQLGLWSEAAEAYGAAIDCDPEAAPSRLNFAIALAAIGRVNEASAEYRRLATYPAARIDALTRLAVLKPDGIADDELLSLRTLATADLTEEQRIGLLFALGGVDDAREDWDAAFEAYTAGNLMKRQALARAGANPTMVARQNTAAADFVKTRLDRDFIASHGEPGASKAAPIFIVGFPRSGSTLVEQVLASHPGVQGLGESSALAGVLEGRFPYSDEPASGDHFRALAETYLAAQKARGWDGRRRLVDKTLENYLHVGVIGLMFPRATILHSRRDPVDTGFACYRQLFAAGNETLYDLTEIGEEYRRYRNLMDHWDAVLPGRVSVVDHEALVLDPEARIPWLVTDVCGLDWDPACFHFERTERGVTTASGAQVRRPIFTSSLGRWRPYARRLQPLLAALGPHAPEDV